MHVRRYLGVFRDKFLGLKTGNVIIDLLCSELSGLSKVLVGVSTSYEMHSLSMESPLIAIVVGS